MKMTSLDNTWKHAPCEQSKRLVELGVVLETEKYWASPIGHYIGEFRLYPASRTRPESVGLHKTYTPAPDVAELGKVLPVSFKTSKGAQYKLNSERDCHGHYLIWYDSPGHMSTILDANWIENEAEVRCAALIYLIEKKICVWDQEKQLLIAA